MAHVCVRVRACVRVCASVRPCACVYVCVHVCMGAHAHVQAELAAIRLEKEDKEHTITDLKAEVSRLQDELARQVISSSESHEALELSRVLGQQEAARNQLHAAAVQQDMLHLQVHPVFICPRECQTMMRCSVQHAV